MKPVLPCLAVSRTEWRIEIGPEEFGVLSVGGLSWKNCFQPFEKLETHSRCGRIRISSEETGKGCTVPVDRDGHGVSEDGMEKFPCEDSRGGESADSRGFKILMTLWRGGRLDVLTVDDDPNFFLHSLARLKIRFEGGETDFILKPLPQRGTLSTRWKRKFFGS